MTAPRWRRLSLRGAFAAIVAYLTIESGSCLLRPPLFPYNPNTRWIEATPYLTGSPAFTIRTNNFGFRNAEDFHFPIPKTRPRVLMVGDSMMFGGPNDHGIDDALAAALPSHEVVNGGSPGADVRFYADMVDEYLGPLAPDVLLVGLYLGNDFAGPLAEQRATMRYQAIQAVKWAFPRTVSFVKRLRVKRGARRGAETSQPLSPSRFQERVADEVTHVAKGLSLDPARLRADVAAYPLAELLRRRPAVLCEQGARAVAQAILFRSDLADTLLLQSDNALRNVEDALAQVDRIRNAVQDRRPAPRLIFVLFPVSFMMDERYAAFYRDLGYVLPPPATNYPLYERVRAHLQEGGLEALDLHETLRGRPAFFDEDWHLNAEGNGLVGEAMARWIIK